MIRNLSRLNQPLALLLCLILLIAIIIWLQPGNGSFASDTGLRLFQVEQLKQNNLQTLAVPYPGEIFDPDWEYAPYYYAYTKVNGEALFNVSPFLLIGTALLPESLGYAARSILPALGGLLTAFGVSLLAKESDLRHPSLMMGATLFATPILFYSLAFWDHTLGSAFAIFGVYFGVLGLKRNKVWFGLTAGILLGLGLGQRPEMYVFAVAFGTAFIIVAWRQWKQIIGVALGGIFGALPVWFLQYLWVGHPFGMAFAPHFFGYGDPTPRPFNLPSYARGYRIGSMLFTLDGGRPLTWLAALLFSSPSSQSS